MLIKRIVDFLPPWWKTVHNEERAKGLFFKKESKAISKIFPILWRYGQPWYVLKVSDYNECYRLEFKTKTRHMYLRKKVYTEYVAVRVGVEDVKFYAFDCGTFGNQMCPMKVVVPRFYVLPWPVSLTLCPPWVQSLHQNGGLTWA